MVHTEAQHRDERGVEVTTFKRLTSGGLIDRKRTVSFTFDGERLTGFYGDTLASALLANNKLLVARSFKYHRPRGIMAAGIEEPNALMTIGEGARSEPNITATALPLTHGLHARSQNAWPNLAFDVMAVNTLLAPIFGAGFYYKTFMGPTKKSWMFFEPFIRRAAGQGKINAATDSARYNVQHDFCDVLVVGSGPAGLAASLTATRAGLRVILAEQDSDWGGNAFSMAMEPMDYWRKEVLDELHAAKETKCFTRTTVQGLYDGNQAVICTDDDLPQKMLHVLRYGTIVFATGATERPLVFSNNDKPGVLLASALRTYLNRYAVSPVESAVIATNNDSAYQSAFDLAAAGWL